MNYFEVLFIVSSKNGFYGNEVVFIVFDGSEVVQVGFLQILIGVMYFLGFVFKYYYIGYYFVLLEFG